MGGILKSTTLPSSRQCRDEVSRKRAWGKSRLEMLLILPLLPTILLLLPHTAASPEKESHVFTHLLSSQSPFLLFPNLDPRAQTNVRKIAKWTSASKKHLSQNRPGAHQPWTKREISELYNKPPQQWSKQGERPPYFLPIPKLASNSVDFLVRPLDGINSFQMSPPPPPPPLPLPSSLRRALRWPPWPPDPHRLGGEVPKSGQEGLQGLQGLPRLGGEVPKSGQEGQQRLQGKGSPQWHIWNLGPPRRIRGIPVETSLTKALNRWASLPQRTRWASLPQRTTAKFRRTPKTQLRRRKRAHKVAKRGPLCMRRCLV